MLRCELVGVDGRVAVLALAVVLSTWFAAQSADFPPGLWKETGANPSGLCRFAASTGSPPSITASGRAASANNVEIRCTLARLTRSRAGGSVSSNGSSTILSVIPDGSTVKKGDLLCELDSAEYEELVRRQTIGVKKAMAEHPRRPAQFTRLPRSISVPISKEAFDKLSKRSRGRSP